MSSVPAFSIGQAVAAKKIRASSVKLHSAILGLAFAASIPALHAATDAWDGSTDSLWATATNWATDVSAPGTGESATFNGAGNGNTVVDLGAGVTVGSVLFDSGSAAAYTIGSGAIGSQTLSLDNAGAITVNAGVTSAQTFNANLALNSAAGATTTITNNGSGVLAFAGAINANVASGNGVLNVDGTGDTTISGAITKTGAGSNALFKKGSGTLTLSNGSVWSGAGAVQTAFSGPFTVQQGTLLLGGGTHTVTGEAVIGGVVTHGGAGQNAKIQVDAGALSVSGFLSVGRGNGTGAVSSDLVLNNAASVTAGNISAGFNAGNTANLPKGSITLNGTSSLTVSGGTNRVFFLGESVGSDMTLTVNDSAVVTNTTGRVGLNNNANNSASLTIGSATGKGTVIMNGGTINVSSTDIGKGLNNTQAGNGTLTVKTGATYNNEGDFRTGFAGSASGQATVNVDGGTINIGSTVTRWMQIGYWDFTNSTINVTGGNLNLNGGSSIRFNINNNTGTNAINQSGGNVTFYSDNQTTIGGTGVLEMQAVGGAASNNTYNLNGGTLTVTQVMSTATTGTRTFNLNGGTLKAAKATTAFLNLGAGNARANVRNGGALVDTNGFDVTIAQALEHSNVGGDNATDGGLTKSGLGKLTLSGVNTYTGNTTINSGTLALASTGSIANSATIIANGTFDVSAVTGFTVGASQTLRGSGSVIGATTVNGTLAPGNSPGLLTFSGDLSLGASSTSQLEINGTTRGSGYDAVDVGGALSYGGVMSLVFDAPISAGTYDLFGGFSGQSGTFASVSVGGSFAEAFSGSPVITGSGWSASSASWSYAFDNGSGDLTISAIPEPSAFAALAGLVGLGLVGSRRRRR